MPSKGSSSSMRPRIRRGGNTVCKLQVANWKLPHSFAKMGTFGEDKLEAAKLQLW